VGIRVWGIDFFLRLVAFLLPPSSTSDAQSQRSPTATPSSPDSTTWHEQQSASKDRQLATFALGLVELESWEDQGTRSIRATAGRLEPPVSLAAH
jgi:hypothetical protein